MATPNILQILRLMQQQGANVCRAPGGAPGYDPDNDGSSQGGLLSRLQALDAQQNPGQRPVEKDGDGRSMPPDRNFRQVSRASPVARLQGAIDTSTRFPVQRTAPFGASPSLDPSASATGGAENPASPMSDPFYGGPSTPFTYPMARRKGEEEDDEDKDNEPNTAEWVRRFREVAEERAKARGKFTPSDPGNECTRQNEEDMKDCNARWPDYAHRTFYQACKDVAGKRLVECQNNGGTPGSRKRWDEDMEEIWRNYSR